MHSARPSIHPCWGHPCIGCAEPDFWDKMTPFYGHLAGFPGFGVHSNVDRIGLWATAGVAAAFAAHGFVQLGKRYVQAKQRAAPPPAAKPAPPEEKGADS